MAVNVDERMAAARRAYERLAPEERRGIDRVAGALWASLREENKGLMADQATCLEIIAAVGQLLNALDGQVRTCPDVRCSECVGCAEGCVAGE